MYDNIPNVGKWRDPVDNLVLVFDGKEGWWESGKDITKFPIEAMKRIYSSRLMYYHKICTFKDYAETLKD